VPAAQKGQRFGGRQKGTPNKVNGALREAILAAADEAGGEGGVQAYLLMQAKINPVAFMGLLGKILPTQLSGEGGGPVEIISKRQRDAAVQAATRADT
jgi:hypothetical protein